MAHPIARTPVDGSKRHIASGDGQGADGCEALDPGTARVGTDPREAGLEGSKPVHGHNAGRVPANKGRRYPPEVLTPEEIQALLDACALKPHTELRNRAFLAILYRTGLRCSEALALEPKDVDFFGSSVRILHGKGDRARTVGIDQGALDMIKEWVVERERRGFTRTQPLFCTSTGKAMSGSYVREQIKRLGIKARISKRVHAHGLRHTHAFELKRRPISGRVLPGQSDFETAHPRTDATRAHDVRQKPLRTKGCSRSRRFRRKASSVSSMHPCRSEHT